MDLPSLAQPKKIICIYGILKTMPIAEDRYLVRLRHLMNLIQMNLSHRDKETTETSWEGRQRSRSPTTLVADTGQHKLQKQLESRAAEASKMQPRYKKGRTTSLSDEYSSDDGESQKGRDDKNELGRQTQRSRSLTILAADAGHHKLKKELEILKK